MAMAWVPFRPEGQVIDLGPGTFDIDFDGSGTRELAEIHAKNGETQPIKDIQDAKIASTEQNNLQLRGALRYTIERVTEVVPGKKYRVYIQVYCTA